MNSKSNFLLFNYVQRTVVAFDMFFFSTWGLLVFEQSTEMRPVCFKGSLTLCFSTFFFFFFFQCSVACCWVEAQKRDKVCHLCCCCCFSHVHISRAKKLIKTHTGRTLSSKQWDVTINKLQEVGSLLPGCIMLTHFNKSKITALSSVCGKKECAHFIL